MMVELNEELISEKQLVRDEDNGLEIIKTCLESIKLNSCQCENLLQYVLIYLFTDEEERNYIKMIFLKNSQITSE